MSDSTKVVSSIDYHQRRGVAWDIIDEAINTYDEWMLDDDYNAIGVLRRIVGRMRERRALYNESGPAS